ncbi:MAG: glycosyltransferase family 9 protein [Planctomycetes bacterium]|nr:glycosyltransferase family 9 protein [Planctomycetota bacterium]MBU4399357.1 glycosyltransferase family 9 protein [Planctomycetota bacterium]MCG2683336.1 glycosyltransferase family 9 protein [Planctomycetales bacterium]
MKIAVFLPNWLGDVAMATPTLRSLRRHFGPRARIVGIMRPYLADVPAGTSWLDEQWFFDPRSKQRELRSRAVARRMRGERFDIAVLMTNSLRTAWVAWRGGAKRRVGYVRYGRGPLLTDKLYPLGACHWLSQCHPRRIVPEPMVETYLKLARSIGCEEESPRLELTTTQADERSADAVFERLGLCGDRPVAALNSSGAYGGSKLWPVEYFGRLTRCIVDELDYDVLVLCGPKEREIAREVVRLAEAGKGDRHLLCEAPVGPFRQKVPVPFSGRVCSMADQPMDLGTAKACIRRCRVMVSTDSGPRHVAAALGLPVVTLFGPMLPVWSENPTQRAANLVLDLDCIGCHKRVCPLGHHRCMRDLSVETVFAAVRDVLH